MKYHVQSETVAIVSTIVRNIDQSICTNNGELHEKRMKKRIVKKVDHRPGDSQTNTSHVHRLIPQPLASEDLEKSQNGRIETLS